MNAGEQRSNAYQWWRWPLVPVAAILGAMAGGFFIAVMQWVALKTTGAAYGEGLMKGFFLPLANVVIGGYLYGYLSCMVAPRAKVRTGMIMSGILAVLMVLAITIYWMSADHTASHKAIQALLYFSNAFSAMVAVSMFNKEKTVCR